MKNKSRSNINTSNNVANNATRKKEKKGNKSKHPKLKKALIIILLLFILSILVGIGIFCGIFFSDKFALSKEDLLLANANTTVYDKDGNVICELSGSENREVISIQDMSKYLPEAFVSIEDERFYQHNGVDWKRTIAAATKYLTHNGNSSFGGSSITQQLVKNITDEKENSGIAGVERKIKEMSRAYQVEKMISKDQILELYLNVIPLGADGGDICGVEIASTYYFNKSASDLSVEECAFLAGINNAPNTYNPFKNSGDAEKQAAVDKKIKTRTETVLLKMKDLGYINGDEYKTAYDNVENGLKFSKGQLPGSNIKSYFVQASVNQVIDDLVENKVYSEEYAKSRVFGGGYKIYTTESTKVQANLETVYRSDKYILTSSKTSGHSQSAMVVIDHTTGQVVGCMGGLGSDVDATGINRAVSSMRQPGSSIKSIGVYACGIEKGIITAGTVYDNSATTFGGGYSPKTTSEKAGLCTVRDALEVSSNVVACKIMSEIGPDNAIDFMRKCGINTLVKASENKKKNDSNLAIALGGLTNGVTPLEMASAYAMIANNGVYISPTFYTKVEDSAGNIIMETKQTTQRVMSENNAYVMKNLLEQPVIGSEGTARGCKINGMEVSAKTGTTNSNVDRWLCGFTPYYTAATWYGYDDGKTPINGSENFSGKLWTDVMTAIHKDLKSESFIRPSGVVDVQICRKSGCKASSSCTDTYTEVYAAGTEPQECPGHSTKICKDSGLLATEYCPNTEYVTFIPEKERNASWSTNSNGKYASATEKCNIHTSPQVTNVPANTVTTPTEEVTTTDISVPDVVGKTEASAREVLKDINVNVKYKSDDTKADGVVLSQSLQAGTLVSKDASITVTINKIEKKKEEVVENKTQNTNVVVNTTKPQ